MLQELLITNIFSHYINLNHGHQFNICFANPHKPLSQSLTEDFCNSIYRETINTLSFI